jgi:hypothetical protein
MHRGWRVIGWFLGGFWAFFLVAITLTPHDLWAHLVAWWGVIAAGVSIAGAAIIGLAKYVGVIGAMWKSASNVADYARSQRRLAAIMSAVGVLVAVFTFMVLWFSKSP